MNTFLPFPDFGHSAVVLDMKRLGKQRVECKQILLGQFPNHPVCRMWKGYESALRSYAIEICLAWRALRYKDTCLDWFLAQEYVNTGMPPWLGDERVHLSHQRNLVRKWPEYYGRIFNVEPEEGYYWPVLD